MRLQLWTLLVLAGLGACGPAAPKRPNLLLILVDDLRWDAMSCAGNTALNTPGFDRLAREGVRFSQAFVTTSLCCPSRASIFSGLDPEAHGVQDISAELADSVAIFPDRLRSAGYETAHIGKWHLNRYANRDPAFERWVSFVTWVPYQNPELVVENSLMKFEGHLTDVLTDLAVHFVQQEHERPFFLVLSHMAPHMPFNPQERFVGSFDQTPIALAGNVGPPDESKPPWLQCRQASADWSELARKYYEMVAGVDESVSKVLAALEQQGVLDDTLIILMSDNGLHLGEHGLGDKRSAYEESIRIPLLVRYPPWFSAGQVVDGSIALNTDIAASFLEAAGLESPGVNLRALADGRASRDYFRYRYWQSPSDDPVAHCTPSLRALRTRRWKLIESVDGEGAPFEEVYDLSTDPLELSNLSGSAQLGASTADSLRALLGRRN
jgi:N-acetylglucosamine-6-sulfatase